MYSRYLLLQQLLIVVASILTIEYGHTYSSFFFLSLSYICFFVSEFFLQNSSYGHTCAFFFFSISINCLLVSRLFSYAKSFGERK